MSIRYGCESAQGIALGRNDWPYSLRTVTTSLPSGMRSPRLVKIWTTPLAAFDPYSDDAAAPFTTSMRSMSSELMSARPWCVIVPSTMISGPGVAVEAHGGTVQAEGDVRAVAPRSRIAGSPPGAPLGLISRAPATLPSSDPSAETPGASCSWAAVTIPTEVVSFFRSISPATPVTTTASSVIGSNLSTKSWVWVPGVSVIWRVVAEYPM